MKISTAMLLAAGRGERLMPLTKDYPKPLLPFHGKPLIVHHLEHLKTVGIKNVVINVSYLAKKIIETLGNGSNFGLQIEYSYEETPLGAGGGIRQALPLLGTEPFLLISSDIWTNFPLRKFFQADWSLDKNLLHAVVTDKKKPEDGDFDLQDGHLLIFSDPQYTYGYIAVVHPSIFANQAPGTAGIKIAFNKAIESQRATGEYYKNIVNINTLQDYQALHQSRVFENL